MPTNDQTNNDFERVKNTDSTVAHLLRAGRTLEDIIVALAAEKEAAHKRVMELESIAPRKIKTPDGKVMIWRCPDELVPLSPNNQIRTAEGSSGMPG